MSIPRWIRRHDPKLVAIGPAVWQLPRMFEYLTPKTHQVPPCVSRGNLFGVYLFPDGSADVCHIWCQSVQPFDSFPILLNLWHPTPTPPPEMLRWGIKGELYLAYVNSQMNRQTWTKVGVNRTASPYFWIVDPLAPPPQCPLLSRGAICLAYIYSQMDLQMFAKFGANRSSRLAASPDFWICDTLPPPHPPKCSPGVLRDEFYLAYVHSQMNRQTWTKVGVNRTAPPYFWMVDSLNRPSAPLVSRGAIVWRKSIPILIWLVCQFGANRPSRLVGFLPNLC